MPPRHGKSELASVRFPAWYLGRNPDKRLILASYAADLAHRFSKLVRNVVDDPRYEAIFPGVALAQDSRSADAWDLAGRRGGMKAVGVGGPLTGFGANVLLIDDPVKNRAEADSETYRQNVWDWYTSTAYTRLEEGGAVVVIQTRWHEDDLTGRLLEAQGTDPNADQWTVIHMPALSDDGLPLWPEKYSLEDLERIRPTVGPRDWEALYQGRPRPPEGAMFRREQFVIEDKPPAGLNWARGWDLAASEKTSADYTCGAKCAIDKQGDLWIADLARWRQTWPETVSDMAQVAATEPGIIWGVEKQGFQLAAIQQLRADKRFMRVSLQSVDADRDKVSRALVWQPRRVHLVSGEWVQAFLSECLSFPLGKHDDQVDAVSVAVDALERCMGFYVYAGAGETRDGLRGIQ